MYQDGYYIGIVEQAQRRENTYTDGNIDTVKNIFGEKKVVGNINTEVVVSYEFKLQGHSEVFHKNGEHIIQAGDKMIVRAVKNGHGIYDVEACKNFTHGWIFGGSSGFKDGLRIPLYIIGSFFGSLFASWILGGLVEWLLPEDYEFIVRQGGYLVLWIILLILFVWSSIKLGRCERKINQEFRAMQFPENFSE